MCSSLTDDRSTIRCTYVCAIGVSKTLTKQHRTIKWHFQLSCYITPPPFIVNHHTALLVYISILFLNFRYIQQSRNDVPFPIHYIFRAFPKLIPTHLNSDVYQYILKVPYSLPSVPTTSVLIAYHVNAPNDHHIIRYTYHLPIHITCHLIPHQASLYVYFQPESKTIEDNPKQNCNKTSDQINHKTLLDLTRGFQRVEMNWGPRGHRSDI